MWADEILKNAEKEHVLEDVLDIEISYERFFRKSPLFFKIGGVEETMNYLSDLKQKYLENNKRAKELGIDVSDFPIELNYIERQN